MADDTETGFWEQTFDNCVLRQIHMDVEQDNLEKLKLSVSKKKQLDVLKPQHELEKTAENRTFITPYRQNYLLPITL